MRRVSIIFCACAGLTAVLIAGVRVDEVDERDASGDWTSSYCTVQGDGEGIKDPINVFIQNRNSSSYRWVTFGDEAAVEGSATCKPATSACPEPASSCKQVVDAASCPACPCELVLQEDLQLSHTQMLNFAEPKCKGQTADEPLDVLVIGLGTGMVHSNLWGLCPQGSLRIRSVELSEQMKSIAHTYFGLSLVEGESEVTVSDAADFVRSQAAQNDSSLKYDIIFSDAFIGGGKTPDKLLTEQFLTDAKTLLKPGGTLAHHIWHESPGNSQVALDYTAVLPTYRKVFGETNIVTHDIPRPQNAFDGFIYATLPGDENE